MLETLVALLLDPILRIRIFIWNIRIYGKCPTLFLVDFLLYFYRIFYFTYHLFSTEPEEETYGESVYASLDLIFQKVNHSSHTSFCDLGSGLGKVVFFADRVLKLNAVGIECNQNFVKISSYFKYIFRFKRSQFVVGDFKKEIPTADIYLSPNTCLTETSLALLAKVLSKKKSGTLVISISKPLPLDNADIIYQDKLLFSWGLATVFVQRVYDTLK